MLSRTLPVVLALCLAQLVAFAVARAADVPQLGADATSDELIDALTPRPGAPPLQYRGLRLLTAKPGSAPEEAMPAVGLDIKFEVNSARLSDEARATIKQLGTALQAPAMEKYHFLVEGHTDSTGTPEHNLALSKMRAETVRGQLLKVYGIAPNRLEAMGRGQTMPLDPADPKNPANRRVQVVNIGE
jgi:outer membrane protein OmpA-like peptidoglycan-associated protein